MLKKIIAILVVLFVLQISASIANAASVIVVGPIVIVIPERHYQEVKVCRVHHGHTHCHIEYRTGGM